MLFNSIEFAIFLPIVFLLFWSLKKQKLHFQNLILLIAGYVFYGWWNWRFLSLIVISSFVDYYTGLKIADSDSKKKKKQFLILSIITNIGFLSFFKYYNFFIDSFIDLSENFGFQANIHSLNIILPVGISFYTFQTMSYTLDIYNGKMNPTKDILAFFTYVSFFPQLVAGPIERAKALLPQFLEKRKFNYLQAAGGMRQILWGLFKKMVIADNIAGNVNLIFAQEESLPGSVLFMGSVFFAFQIYCDFSGYSDIALGTAKLFGFKLSTNFALPYFSRNISEFWSRWHISLSTWFRDYVYIPLGGNRSGKAMQIRNSIITFTLSGLWHGANWTFVFWGLIHGLLYIPVILLGKKKKTGIIAQNSFFPSIKDLVLLISTFLGVTLAWIFFRADSISQAFSYLMHLFSNKWINPFDKIGDIDRNAYLWISLLVLIEWIQRKKEYTADIAYLNKYIRHAIYVVFIFILMVFGYSGENAFIYFQF